MLTLPLSTLMQLLAQLCLCPSIQASLHHAMVCGSVLEFPTLTSQDKLLKCVWHLHKTEPWPQSCTLLLQLWKLGCKQPSHQASKCSNSWEKVWSSGHCSSSHWRVRLLGGLTCLFVLFLLSILSWPDYASTWREMANMTTFKKQSLWWSIESKNTWTSNCKTHSWRGRYEEVTNEYSCIFSILGLIY